jgi:hypothetical protein
MDTIRAGVVGLKSRQAAHGWGTPSIAIQAMVMVDLDHLILAVPLGYKYTSGGHPTLSKDYDSSVADALYSHTRIKMPYSLAIISY